MKKIFFILFSFFVAHIAGAETGGTQSPTALSNPLGNDIKTPSDLIGQIINSVLGVVGTIALAMFIYGGLLWMTSGGGDGVKKGKDVIVWATLGLVVVFMSYAAVNFVLKDVLMQ